MNGYKVLEEAAKLLGLSSVDENLKIIGLPLVNEILIDLGFAPLSSLYEKVGISSEKMLSALRFGVSALVAGAQGDFDSRESMSATYTAKKAELKNHISRVKNVIPGGEM